MPTVPESLVIAEEALAGGDLARAQFIYERILEAVPDEPFALNGLGVVAFRGGQLEEAERQHQRAIAGFAGHPAFFNNLHLVYRKLGRLDEAIDCCRAALELDGSNPDLHNNLGAALEVVGQLEPAAESLRRAIELKPGYAEAHYNLGRTLLRLRRLDEAEHQFRRAIELAPGDASAYNNLGSVLQRQARFAEAGDCFEAALARQPDAAEARRNRALLRLLQGDFSGAWPDYESRWQLSDVRQPNFAQPRWAGQPLADRTILLWGEQGLGDNIQMIRYAALLKRQGAKVLVECRDVLQGVLSTAQGVDGLVDTTTDDVTFDYYVPMMSLPAACATTVETIPAEVPYLTADPTRVASWQSELAGVGELKIGIHWQGSRGFAGDPYRSIRLAEFEPLAACPGVWLFSLQKGKGREQLATVPFAGAITDLGDQLDDLSDTAAAMRNLDLVITCDSAPAHLAGALGVPVWVALPIAPNWRWLLARDDSPWYPTMRLFRQSRFDDWSDVLARIVERLQAERSGKLGG